MHDNPNDPLNRPGGPLTPNPQPTGSRPGDTMDNVTASIRDFVNKVLETINKAIDRALNVRDTTVLLRLSEPSSDAIDTLVSAGIFKTRAERVVFVKGDPDLDFAVVANAIDIAKGAGIDKIGLMTPKIEAGQ